MTASEHPVRERHCPVMGRSETIADGADRHRAGLDPQLTASRVRFWAIKRRHLLALLATEQLALPWNYTNAGALQLLHDLFNFLRMNYG
jgi:hypothetical protein